jgi:hypothetical protein
MNRKKIIIGLLVILIIILYANSLFLGFSVKWLAVTIHCILVFIIPMLSILLFRRVDMKTGIIAAILISIFFLPYFYLNDKIISYSELKFYNERKQVLTGLGNKILTHSSQRVSDKLLNRKLNEIGIDTFQNTNDYAIFKISSGHYMFNGFIFTNGESLPDSAFGIKINEKERIGNHWYSFSCDSLDLN